MDSRWARRWTRYAKRDTSAEKDTNACRRTMRRTQFSGAEKRGEPTPRKPSMLGSRSQVSSDKPLNLRHSERDGKSEVSLSRSPRRSVLRSARGSATAQSASFKAGSEGLFSLINQSAIKESNACEQGAGLGASCRRGDDESVATSW
jgi:SET domain-containing protein